MPSWKKIKSKLVHKNLWFTLWEDDVIRPDKTRGKYYVVRKKPTSIVIPLDRNKIYLVNLYRYPISRKSWELPMGTFEKDSSALVLAKRELQEETGFKAKKWEYVGQFSWANGMSNQMAKVYLASGLVFGKTNREGTEHDMIMKAFTLKQIEQMIEKGTIIDSGTIIGIYQYKLLKNL